MQHPMVQCTARSKNSGEQCRRWAIVGGNVCIMHGGRAPQVRAAAQLRILGMVSPALHALSKLIESADSDSVKLSAVKDVLDRAGLAAAHLSKVEVTGKDGENLFPVEAVEAYLKSRNATDDDYETRS